MHGQKMVAYVNSFLDINVEYHEYKNFLVCGYDVIGNEWYGDGSYDPFKHDPMPKPRTYKFYDTQGKVIAENQAIPQETVNTNDTSKEPKISAFPPEQMKCRFSKSDAKESSEMSYSTDGKNWQEINTGYHYQFFFEDTGYLVFSYDWSMQHEAAVIYKSVDGGENWIFVSDTPTDGLLQNTVFFDENTGMFEYGIAGTSSYILYATWDGVNTFKKIDVPTELQGQADKIRTILVEIE